MSKAKVQHFKALDAARGIAALLVFLYHFWSLNEVSNLSPLGLNLSAFFKGGHVGLDMFFVLSGFLIFCSLYRNGVNIKYFVRRILRIAPIYYVSLFAVIAILTPSLVLTWSGRWDIFTHLLFIHSFTPATYHGINPVLWSLSIEMLFYLVLPLIFIFTGKKTLKIVVASFLILILAYSYRHLMYLVIEAREWDWLKAVVYTENILGRFDHFAFGILAGLVALKWSGKGIGSKTLMLAAALLGLVGMYYGMNMFAELQHSFRESYLAHMFLHGLVAASTALFLLGIVKTFNWAKLILGNPILNFIGLISYSFYIWHYLIIENVKEIEALTNPQRFVISFGLVLVLSAVTYFLVERPFLRLKKY